MLCAVVAVAIDGNSPFRILVLFSVIVEATAPVLRNTQQTPNLKIDGTLSIGFRKNHFSIILWKDNLPTKKVRILLYIPTCTISCRHSILVRTFGAGITCSSCSTSEKKINYILILNTYLTRHVRKSEITRLNHIRYLPRYRRGASTFFISKRYNTKQRKIWRIKKWVLNIFINDLIKATWGTDN